jgi:D-xylose reductase
MFTYAKVKPATLQIEHHPYYVQPHLLELARQHDIKVTAYSSFGPQSFLECDMKVAADTPLLFDHPVIKKIADAHGKTPAQVLLRWSTQRGLSVIPKSNSPNRLAQNLDVTSFDLKDSEIEEISGLDKNLKFNAPTNVCYTPPFVHVCVWVWIANVSNSTVSLATSLHKWTCVPLRVFSFPFFSLHMIR